jgi:integrase
MTASPTGLREASGATLRAALDRKVIERAQKTVDAIGGRVTLLDSVCGGLRLVLGPRSGRFTYAYRPRGIDALGKRWPQRTMTIGDLTSMSVAEARLKVDVIRNAVRRGEDPAEDARRAAELEALNARRARTVSQFAEEYIERRLASGSRHHDGEARNLRFGISEMGVGPVDPSTITIVAVADLSHLHRDHPACARNRLGSLSRFCDWLVSQQVMPVNPVKQLGRADRPSAVPKRERVIAAAEARAIWQAANELDDARGDFIRAALAMPLRRQELSELLVGEVDLAANVIRLPPEKVKNRRTFELPIPAAVLPMIAARCAAVAPEVRVFQMASGCKPMNSWKALMTAIRRRSGIDYDLHDCRRTFVSRCAEAGIGDIWLLDSLLNHVAATTHGGVVGRYQFAKQADARRDVMAAWSRQLEHAIEHGEWPKQPDNVVALAARGAA